MSNPTRFPLFALAAALIAVLPAAGQGQPPAPAPAPDPIVRSGETQAISPNVYYISDHSVPLVPNVGIIVGKTGTLVVETGLGPPNGRTVLAEARKVSGKTKLYLVTTHIHPEHDLGAQAFPASITFIRSKDQVREISEEGLKLADTFAKRSAVTKQLLAGAHFRKADITFDKTYDLDLGGGVKVRLTAMGPNHTQGDTAIFVEPDKVLFAGDLAMKGPPAFASSKSSLNQWLKSLDVLDAMKPTVLVPSHGPIGDAGYIAGYRKYLILIRDRTRALKHDGKTVDQAVETVTADLKSQGFDASRAAAAIRVAYAEAGN